MWLLIGRPRLWDMSLEILGKFQFFVKFGLIFKETIWASKIIITLIIHIQNWQKKCLKNSNIKKFWKLCPNFDGLCMNDESKYLGNSFAEIFTTSVKCFHIIKAANYAILKLNIALGWAAFCSLFCLWIGQFLKPSLTKTIKVSTNLL